MDEIFELEGEEFTPSSAPDDESHQTSLDSQWTPEEEARFRRPTTDSDAQRIMASSVPISIPSFRKARNSSGDGAAAPPALSATFIPPHQLSHHDPSLLLKGSTPLSSSSRLRTRNLVLQSTGFLPKNLTEGFRAPHTPSHSRGSAGNSGALEAATSTGAPQRPARISGLTAAALQPLETAISTASASGLLSIPEQPDGRMAA